MKMAFEASIISYISMFFLSIGVVLLQLVFTHNQALQIEEYAIMMIEHHNRYDTDVAALIQAKTIACSSCLLDITPMYGNGNLRYEVRVSYSVALTPLKKVMRNSLVALSTEVSN